MSTSPTSEQEVPSGADATLVCPRCRRKDEGGSREAVVRCPTHKHTAMVPPDALAAGDGDPFLGLVVAERFAILGRLGAGSMGTVYRAHQAAMRRDVALKIVRSDRLTDPQAKGRFAQEAHATSLLTSPHTVTVFDFGEIKAKSHDPPQVDGALFLAMELLEGESLGTRLKRDGALDVEEAVGIARDALSSLSEAHDKGVIHRDLKPDNLFLLPRPDGRGQICKVVDFGIAKVLDPGTDVDALETQAGTVFGTPRYMSPEQAQGKSLDARSDIYALGVILYHMVAGRAPYTDSDAVVVMAHHIKTPPPKLADVAPHPLPDEMVALIESALSKDPIDRPQSASEFVERLDDLRLDKTSPRSSRRSGISSQRGADASGTAPHILASANNGGSGGLDPRRIVAVAAVVAVGLLAGRAMLRPSARALEAKLVSFATIGTYAVGIDVATDVAASANAAAAQTAAAPRPAAPAPPSVLPRKGYRRFDRE